jgi:hypothetical protein
MSKERWMKVKLMMDAVIDHDGYTVRGTVSQSAESNSGGDDEPASYEPEGEASVEIDTVQEYDEVNQRTDFVQVSSISEEETKILEQKLRDYASAHFDEYEEEAFYNELADAEDEDEDDDDLLDDDDEDLEISDEDDDYLDDDEEDDLLDDEDE